MFANSNGLVVHLGGNDGPDSEIYTIKPGGGGKFNVTDNGTDHYSPSWGSSK
jgi:hypothetical protein